MKRNEIFEKYSISKAVWTLAIPTMMGMLVTVIYNLAGAFFVGQLNDVNQVAAITLSMPVFLLLMAIGNIFGAGSGTYISRKLGTKEYDKVRNASAFSFYTAILFGIICIILGLVFMPEILKASGTSIHTYKYAKNYLSIIALGSPIIILGFCLGQLVRAEGSAKEAMKGMMIGTILNIILDPILILWAKLGVTGAAMATIIANTISVIYYCTYFIKKNSVGSISYRYFNLDKDMLKSIFSIGIPASLNSVLMSASSVVLNNFAVSYSDNVVAALGIVSRITMLPAMLLIGLAQGVQPLIGYNFAAKNFDRMKNVIKYAVKSGTIIGIIFTIILFFTGSHITKAFINDINVIKLGDKFIKVIILSVPFLATLFTITSAFQAFGKGIPALILSISRQGLLYIPILTIFNKTWGLNGLISAQPTVDFITIFISVTLLIKTIKQTSKVENLELT